MWSTLLFYPADVAKIRLQAEADAEECHDEAPARSSPLPAAASDPSTAKGAGGGAGHKGGGGGPKSFFGEVLVVLKRPDLWYAGLGAYACLRACLSRLHALSCKIGRRP